MSSSQGWIKLHRTLLDHPRFSDGDWLKLWIFLLTRATHSERKMVFDGAVITLKPGQLITSRDSIVKLCDIERSKVERLLKTLKSEQQIEQQSCSTSRLITILNWSKYQDDEQPNEQPVSNERAATEQRVSTNNNGKNEENGKNEKNPSAFDRFWNAYPKKTGKGDAEKIYHSLRVTPETEELILKAIGWQKRTDSWAKEGGKFIPSPTKWLNARRWEDEPTVNVRTPSNSIKGQGVADILGKERARSLGYCSEEVRP